VLWKGGVVVSAADRSRTLAAALGAGRRTIPTIVRAILDHHYQGRRRDRGSLDLAAFPPQEPVMSEFVMVVLGLMPLHVLPNPPSPTPTAVYPHQSQGFAAYVVGGFMGLGLLLLIMVLLRRPKRMDRPPPEQ
jgi:hypothetical protein